MQENMFVIEGIVTELHVEVGSHNLLEKIDTYYRQRSALTAGGAIVGDLYGQAFNSAALAMYSGEDTQNFACLMDEKVVFGQFAGAEMIQEGQRLKAVVTRRGDAFLAHGLQSPAQGLLWIHHPWGSTAGLFANLKIAIYAFIFASILLGGLRGFLRKCRSGPDLKPFEWNVLRRHRMCRRLRLVDI